jgi:aryl-alcohol dehydrogenase-like predicted oxidoreductase
VAEAVGSEEPDLATAALKFALKPSAVSTVIPGIRNVRQAEMNIAVSDQRPMTDDLERRLREHRWNKAFWYGGK